MLHFPPRYAINLQGSERPLNVLDCSGNPRAAAHIKEYFPRSLWVLVVYDFTNIETFNAGKDLMKAASAAGAGVIFFGNKWSLEKEQGKEPAVGNKYRLWFVDSEQLRHRHDSWTT